MTTYLQGSDGDDTLIGDSGDNYIHPGGGGSDSLAGGAGNDTILSFPYPSGASTLDGGPGDDLLSPLYGVNSVDGGTGIDTLKIDFHSPTTTQNISLSNFNAANGSGTIGNTSFTANFVNIEKFDITLGDGNDFINLSTSTFGASLLRDFGPINDGNDTLLTGSGDDTIRDIYGNDSIDAGGGNDSLDSRYGNDTVLGGAGADTIYDLYGNNSLDGGDGNDQFDWVSYNEETLPSGVSTIAGGPGSDTFFLKLDLSAAQSSDTITDFQAGPGGDVLNVASLVAQFSGYTPGFDPFATGYLRLLQSGSDALLQADKDGAANGSNFVTVLTLKNIVATAPTSDNFVGLGESNDLIQGTPGNDFISGFGGNDTIYAQAGDDNILGGDGNDSIEGYSGLDTLSGGNGNDTLNGDFSTNAFPPNSGGDSLSGDAGGDQLHGHQGNDTLLGGIGNDSLYGDTQNDSIDGGDGNDLISGDAQSTFLGGYSDTVFGGLGVDTIIADGGADLIDAGPGHDVVMNISANDLNSGTDTITGGAGRDEFWLAPIAFNSSLVPDAITDFQAGAGGDWLYLVDLLNSPQFTGYTSGSDPLQAGYVRFLQSGPDTLVQADTNGAAGGQNFVTILTLQNTAATSFTVSNLLYPGNSNPGTAEIAVTGNNIDIIDGDTTPSDADGTDFGFAAQGGPPVTRTFMVTNLGTSSLLNLGWSLSSPFSLTGGLFGPIGPGESQAVTLQLDTSTPGIFSRTFSVYSNDLDESPFDFRITGLVGAVTALEASGTTVLRSAFNHFFLGDSVGTGPSMKYQGTDFTAGQFGAWAPIGAEKTGNSYEIAWKFWNADQYTVWNTDANGNYVGNAVGVVPGSDPSLQSAETLFQQDLNGDGRIGPPPPAPIESHGATTLATAASLFYLQDNNGAGPTLKFQGANFVAGQSGFGAWTPIGAEKTGNGYEIAWKFGNADQYTLWTTDANGNYLTSLMGAVPGSDSALQSAETLFQQDLNGDGRIGPPPVTAIETNGGTKLATAAGLFYLQDNNGAGPTLKFQGANFVAGQSGFGSWTPIGAEKTGNGYEIAWKFGNTDQYVLWSTDANGNYLTSLTGAVPGSDSALQSAETLFQQDLNGDGRIGPPPATPIESHGATTLATATNLFYLQDNTGAGPTLKYQGANFVAGQFGAWAPIGAEASGNGYEIAWKFGSADQYTLWTTDANGNYAASPIGAVPGSDATLQSAETLFQQDLNGDGRIGPLSATPIESHGGTTLATAANLFYLQDTNGVGPTLKYQGANFLAGQFGAWTPIAAEKTGNGYEIAWKFGNADQYTLWSMDANGNYLSNMIGAVAGSDSTLQSAENLFQQDLNGDGQIGAAVSQGQPVTTPIETNGATKLATAANLFYLQDNTGAGPVLKFQGANFVDGQFGAWEPISAEKTVNGYEIAWKFGGADQYTIWNTDANGNYVGNVVGAVTGSDPTLETAETLFQQDLNGDGHFGLF